MNISVAKHAKMGAAVGSITSILRPKWPSRRLKIEESAKEQIMPASMALKLLSVFIGKSKLLIIYWRNIYLKVSVFIGKSKLRFYLQNSFFIS